MSGRRIEGICLTTFGCRISCTQKYFLLSSPQVCLRPTYSGTQTETLAVLFVAVRLFSSLDWISSGKHSLRLTGCPVQLLKIMAAYPLSSSRSERISQARSLISASESKTHPLHNGLWAIWQKPTGWSTDHGYVALSTLRSFMPTFLSTKDVDDLVGLGYCSGKPEVVPGSNKRYAACSWSTILLFLLVEKQWNPNVMGNRMTPVFQRFREHVREAKEANKNARETHEHVNQSQSQSPVGAQRMHQQTVNYPLSMPPRMPTGRGGPPRPSDAPIVAPGARGPFPVHVPGPHVAQVGPCITGASPQHTIGYFAPQQSHILQTPPVQAVPSRLQAQREASTPHIQTNQASFITRGPAPVPEMSTSAPVDVRFRASQNIPDSHNLPQNMSQADRRAILRAGEAVEAALRGRDISCSAREAWWRDVQEREKGTKQSLQKSSPSASRDLGSTPEGTQSQEIGRQWSDLQLALTLSPDVRSDQHGWSTTERLEPIAMDVGLLRSADSPASSVILELASLGIYVLLGNPHAPQSAKLMMSQYGDTRTEIFSNLKAALLDLNLERMKAECGGELGLRSKIGVAVTLIMHLVLEAVSGSLLKKKEVIVSGSEEEIPVRRRLEDSKTRNGSESNEDYDNEDEIQEVTSPGANVLGLFVTGLCTGALECAYLSRKTAEEFRKAGLNKKWTSPDFKDSDVWVDKGQNKATAPVQVSRSVIYLQKRAFTNLQSLASTSAMFRKAVLKLLFRRREMDEDLFRRGVNASTLCDTHGFCLDDPLSCHGVVAILVDHCEFLDVFPEDIRRMSRADKPLSKSLKRKAKESVAAIEKERVKRQRAREITTGSVSSSSDEAKAGSQGSDSENSSSGTDSAEGKNADGTDSNLEVSSSRAANENVENDDKDDE